MADRGAEGSIADHQRQHGGNQAEECQRAQRVRRHAHLPASDEDRRRDRERQRALANAAHNHRVGEEPLSRRSRRPLHRSALRALGLENQRADGIDDQLEERDLDRAEHHRQTSHQGQKSQAGDRHVNAEDEPHRLSDIVVDATPQRDCLDDRAEIVVDQHDRCGLARDIGAPLAHRNTDVSGLQRGCVVHAIARHRDDLTARFQRTHDAQLVVGLGSRAHRDIGQPRGERRVRQRLDLRAGQHVALDQSRLVSDRAGGCRMVARDHHHAHPGGVAPRDGFLDARPQGIAESDKPRQHEIVLGLVSIEHRLVDHGGGDAKHANAAFGHRGGRAFELLPLGRRQAAQQGDGLRRALGGNAQSTVPAVLPDVRHGQQIGPQAVRLDQPKVTARTAGDAVPRVVERHLHRIDRRRRAGQCRGIDQRVIGIGDSVARRNGNGADRRPQPSDGHPVLGQRARLVGTEHHCRAERLDRRGATREHAHARDPPRAHRQEDGQDDGEFLRQQRHADRDPRKQRLQPIAARYAEQQDDRHGEHRSARRRDANDPRDLTAQSRRLELQHRERSPDPPYLARRPCRDHARDAAASRDHRAGVDERLIVPARDRRGIGILNDSRPLTDGRGFAAEQGFIRGDVIRFDQHGICGDSITLPQQQDIPPY